MNTPEQERILAEVESVQRTWMESHLIHDYGDSAVKPLIEAIMYVAAAITVLIQQK